MFEVNGKQYSIKREITFGEYRKINNINSRLTELSKEVGSDDISKLDDDKLVSLAQNFAKTNDEQLTTIVEFLESVVGLEQKDIDSMKLEEAIKVFQEAFKESTTVKKN